jgi:hypothetical protein
MQDLLRDPVDEYTHFEAGLSLLPVLPPEEAVLLLRQRALRLSAAAAALAAQLGELALQEVPDAPAELRPLLAGKKFPALFVVEAEFKIALLRAEVCFVNELVRRISEEGWGPLELWRELHAACARRQDASASSTEAAM